MATFSYTIRKLGEGPDYPDLSHWSFATAGLSCVDADELPQLVVGATYDDEPIVPVLGLDPNQYLIVALLRALAEALAQQDPPRASTS